MGIPNKKIWVPNPGIFFHRFFDTVQVHNNIALCLVETKHFKEALNHFKKSLNLKTKTGDSFGMARTLTNMANCYAQLKLNNERLSCSKQAHDIKLDVYGKHIRFESILVP